MALKKLTMATLAGILFHSTAAVWAGTEEPKVIEQPATKTTEPWEISVGGPGWLANVSG